MPPRLKPIHIVDLIRSFREQTLQIKKTSLQTVASILRKTLSKHDISILRQHDYMVKFVGSPEYAGSGAKDYEKLIPFFEYFAQSNNCYSFAVDDLRGSRRSKAVPGTISNDKRKSDATWQSCDIPHKLVMNDSRKNGYHMVEMSARNSKALSTYKVMLFVDRNPLNKNATTDFHWYREVRSPKWIDHYVRNSTRYTRQIQKGTKKSINKQLSKLLDNVDTPKNPTSPLDDLRNYHGIHTYYRGLRTSKGKRIAVYANKAGWSDILSIFSPKGNIMLDPRSSKRGYDPSTSPDTIDYDLYCKTYVVKRNRGRTSV